MAKHSVNVVVAAGGSGTRYGKQNKLLEPCGVSCVLIEAIKPFLARKDVTRVIVAIDTGASDEFLDALEAAGLDDDRRIIMTRGGASRTRSVKYGLEALSDECDLVLIHDGARPYVTPALISRVIKGAEKSGACIPVVPLVDNILLAGEDGPVPLDRTPYRRVQTPSGFARERIEAAYAAATDDYLDDFTALHAFAPGKVALVPGDPNNIKITVREDLLTFLTGFGYDIHRLTEGRGIKLLGVRVPCPYSFVAHSDGDAAVHAVMDAILTALGEKDIGHLYPVDDPRYDNADSMKLLEGVLGIMRAKGRSVVNCSVTVIAERPTLAPYIDRMRAKMAKALGIPTERFSVAATTNEGVGDIGGGEAIAACATVLLK